jgi:hypothetical protein
MADYNVVALGPPGAGKTVYLAALHHAVNSGYLADGVMIDIDHSQQTELTSVYRQIADPTGAWPPGTNRFEPMREFRMRFSVRRTRRPWLFGQSESRDYSAFTIRYVDYAGEWFTEAHHQDRALVAPFDALLNTADVLLCFVDGQRLLNLVRGRKGGTLVEELRQAVDRCRTRGAPVVIVVTKWDLLEGQVRMRDVVGVLMNDKRTRLAQLVKERGGRRRLTRGEVGGIWVVPVSAIGPNFARVGSDGVIKKIGCGEPQPRNITVPLATGLVEVARLELDRHRKETRTFGGLRPADVLSALVTALSFDLTRVAFSYDLVAGVRLLAWPAAFAFYRMRRHARRLRARGVDGVSSVEGAVMYIAGALRDRQRAFAADPAYQAGHLWGDGKGWELR